MATFGELGLPAALIEALAASGCHTPFPIQAAALPNALAGRDVLGRGRTGSGKTVAFAVPTLMALARSDRPRRPNMPRALVLVPTRELASQVARTMGPLAKTLGLRVATVFGGVGQGPQVAALRQGVEVVIACPGRLEDLIQQGHCRLGAVEVCVLDEADHLADLGFLPAVKRLLDQTPERGQRLLFSATLDGAIDALVRRYLHDPVTHSLDPVDAGPPELDHHAFTVAGADKSAVVRELASGRGRTLLFTRTKHGAKKLAATLTRQGIPALDLHGNLSQSQRDRNLAAFAADGPVQVLVATDVAARGIHVADITLVVHVDPPADHKAYLHRSGRTGRAGARGAVATVILPEQAREVSSLMRRAGVRPASAHLQPGDPKTAALTGPPAAPVFRPAPPTPALQGRRPARAGGSRGNARTSWSGGQQRGKPRPPSARTRRSA